MKRRSFLQNTLAVAASSFAFTAKGNPPPQAGAPTFKLNYAPHDGMFANHAGKNFIDQIKFMADQGFRGIEDNGLLPVSAT